jgi:hypothetical protein
MASMILVDGPEEMMFVDERTDNDPLPHLTADGFTIFKSRAVRTPERSRTKPEQPRLCQSEIFHTRFSAIFLILPL